MNKKAVSAILFILMLTSVSALPFSIQADRAKHRTWYVDDDGGADFTKIQDAIDAADPGDTIFVYSGLYHEHLFVYTDYAINLKIMGEDKSNTIIDGGGIGSPISVVTNLEPHNVVISGFTVQNSAWTGLVKLSSGIRLRYASSCIIKDIIVSNCQYGIALGAPYWMPTACTNNVISGNFISDAEFGVYLYMSSRNRVVDNHLSNNDVGIIASENSDNNDIVGNNITNNDVGIDIDWSYNNIISKNTIADNWAGLHAVPSHITVYRNNITNNIIGLFANVGDSLFYHNNLVGNTEQVHGSLHGNIWDDGYPSGGNYWSDQYHGPCADHFSGPNQDIPGSDGITDTPYIINGRNHDKYPLMEPYSPIPATVEIYPETLSLHSVFGRQVAACIELPEGYNVNDIDISTVRLNDEVPAETHPTSIGDYDDDGKPDLMVKFERRDVMQTIFRTAENTLTISGEINRLLFEGSNTIKVNNPV